MEINNTAQTKVNNHYNNTDLDILIAKLKLFGFNWKSKNGIDVLESSDRLHKYIIIRPEVKSTDGLTWIKEGPAKHYYFIGGSGLESISSLFSMNVDTVDISMLDTSKVTRMNYLFNTCSYDIIGLDKLNTSNVKFMNGMFFNYKKDKLDLSNFDTHNVIEMEEMFYGCEIGELNISKFDTSNVRDMVKMFAFCEINSLDLSNFSTSRVTAMYQMFRSSKIKNLNISSFDTSNVEDARQMFMHSEIPFIDVRHFKNIQKSDDMFFNCTGTVFKRVNWDI
ncbi:MAG: BspA family leucine-rich repeat surface protein [Lachnospiraceae bacterium]|nr:BspA family leucine-rich repeat surface protein [Lachnospiraceae bacterium]